ncbi:MAG: D-alanyl-D-alanine carboxypeptidase family protein [Clostridiales bacterium]|nr:D-alanyl-D-alanine carboxypeptidase family protein [Clostridiales bacterium]
MNRRNCQEYKSYPGSMLRKKKRGFSPLLIFAGVFVLLFLVFLFLPFFHAYTDRVLAQNTATDTLAPEAMHPFFPDEPETEQPIQTPPPARLPILVNADHPLPDAYDLSGLIFLSEIDTHLFSVKEEYMMIDSICVSPLLEMLADAHADGITTWQISEGYRSVEAQQRIWDEKYQKYRFVNGLSEQKALQAVSRRVAKPGCSEHHTGLALDLTVPGESFRLTPQAEWLSDHCHEYGFIIRYTAEKEYLTGITAEPWHIRYVGKEAAREIHDKHLCLEEYLLSAEK